VTKAGSIPGRYVHPEADAHAYVAPQERVTIPGSERELAEWVSRHADNVQLRMTEAINRAVRSGTMLEADFYALRDELMSISREFAGNYAPDATEALRYSYEIGYEGGALALQEQGIMASFTRPDVAAIMALANDNFSDLGGQAEMMIDTTLGILRTEAGGIIAQGLARGLHPTQVARDLERTLIERGFEPSEAMKRLEAARQKRTNPINGATPVRTLSTPTEAANYMADGGLLKFIDRAGREWDLRSYCEMAAHTKLMIAKNEGTRQTMREAGVNHYMFSDHATDCPLCEPHEGVVYWTGDGESEGYDVGPSIPLHPNCGHTTIPYVFTE
jgi:hypothetical protein